MNILFPWFQVTSVLHLTPKQEEDKTRFLDKTVSIIPSLVHYKLAYTLYTYLKCLVKGNVMNSQAFDALSYRMSRPLDRSSDVCPFVRHNFTQLN